MIGLPQLDVSSPVSYLVALIVPGLDALLPVLPSETAVIALGVVTAGHSDPRIAALVVLAACGAFLGDNLAYLVGRRFGPVVERRFFGGERGRRRRVWAEQTLHRYGARIIIVCRFIPGGRTAVTLTCGMVGYRRRSFVAATACAGAIWAAYAFFIGRLGGKTFEDRPWAGLLLALGAALLLSILAEVLRRTRPWRVLGRVGSRDHAARDPGPVRARRPPVLHRADIPAPHRRPIQETQPDSQAHLPDEVIAMTAPQRPVHPTAGWTRTALRRAIGALRHLHEETMRGSEAAIFRPESTPRSPRAGAPAAPPGREAPTFKGAGRVA